MGGISGRVVDTPKAGSAVFDNVDNIIVGSNAMALSAASARARELGFETIMLS